jgi:hypothetical protein
VQLFEGNMIVTFATIADNSIAQGGEESGLLTLIAATECVSLCVPMNC